jgi:alkylhydroperoxidase family enzyme
MLGFLEKMTLHPGDLAPADVVPLRAAGLTDEEIADAIHVCASFNLINRLADSMGWELQSQTSIHRYAEMLLKMGYK